MRSHLDQLAGSRIVGEIRGAGLMLGVELVQDKASRTPFASNLEVGLTFDKIAYKKGLIVRCMGDTLGMSPPLIVNETDIDEIAEKFSASLIELEARVL